MSRTCQYITFGIFYGKDPAQDQCFLLGSWFQVILSDLSICWSRLKAGNLCKKHSQPVLSSQLVALEFDGLAGHSG